MDVVFVEQIRRGFHSSRTKSRSHAAFQLSSHGLVVYVLVKGYCAS